MTKDMRAVFNTLAFSLEEEETKIIEDLKRQMDLLEEDNIMLINDKNIFFSFFLKAFEKRKYWEVVL